MKIALYYPWIYLTSGAERSILEFVRRSRHQVTLFTNHYAPDHTYPEFRQLPIVELTRVSVERSFAKVLAAGLRIARQKIDLAGYDALLVVCEGLGDMVVFRNHHLPVYCLCLTPLRPVFDPVYRERYLEGKGGLTRLKLFFFSLAFRLIDRLAWRRYRRILCISRECHRRVLNGGLARVEDLGFAFPGIDAQRLTPTGRREKYFLVPGRIMWTKNIELAIQAFLIFLHQCPEGKDFRMVIAGIVDRKSETYYQKLKKLTEGCPAISFIVHPDDRRLFELYDSAYAVLFTPFNEDWGIVPLEAMTYGKPVIAVNRGGATETVRHGENGLLAEPTVEDFTRCMVRLASDPAQAESMGKFGRQHVQRYDWAHFVEAVDALVAGEKTP